MSDEIKSGKERRALLLTPRNPGKLHSQVTSIIECLGLAGSISVSTPDLEKLQSALTQAQAERDELREILTAINIRVFPGEIDSVESLQLMYAERKFQAAIIDQLRTQLTAAYAKLCAEGEK